jgi:hypothetical protein
MLFMKLLVAVIGAVVAAVAAATTDSVFTDTEKIQVGIAAVVAVSVWWTTNLAGNALTAYAKAGMAAVLAALNLAVSLIADGTLNTADWWQLAVSAMVALGVLAAPGPMWSASPLSNQPKVVGP